MAELDFLNSSRIKNIQESIKKSNDEKERKKHIEGLVREIVSKLNTLGNHPDNIAINNLDDVQASLRNELKRANKPITELMKSLNLSSKEQTSLMKGVEDRSMKAVEGGFEKLFVKKVKDRVEVTNLSDIIIPDKFTISNLSDLQKYFITLADSLKDSLNITLPEPKVIVNTPEVVIPETVIPDVDLQPLIKAINSNLQKIKTNSVSRPLAVRLSDGQKWIKEIVGKMGNISTTLAGFSDQIRLRGKTGGVINPATEESVSPPSSVVSNTLAMTGSPVRISTSVIKIRYIIVNADLGAANPIAAGGSNVSNADGSWVGVILIPGNNPTRIDINDVSQLFFDGTSGDDLSYAYFV